MTEQREIKKKKMRRVAEKKTSSMEIFKRALSQFQTKGLRPKRQILLYSHSQLKQLGNSRFPRSEFGKNTIHT